MLATTLEMLLRRWPLLVVAVILALLAGGGTAVAVPPTQRSVASVLFLPSLTQPGVAGQTNPLLELDSSVSIVAAVVQIGVSDDQTMAKLADAGLTAKYTVEQDARANSGPVLLVTTESVSAKISTETRDILLSEISNRLQKIQDDRVVPANLRVNDFVLSESQKPTLVHKAQIQKAVIAAGGAFVVMIVLILLLERRADRRRNRTASDEDPRDQGSEPMTKEESRAAAKAGRSLSAASRLP